MKFYEVRFQESALKLSDVEIGKLARAALAAEIGLAAQRLEAGRLKVSEKAGTAIEIDGVRYPSRAKARKALGMSYPAFVKKYGYAPGYDPQE